MMLSFICRGCGEIAQSATRPTSCPACGDLRLELRRSPEATATFVSDPGHGWLVVSRERFAAYGLKPAQITPYSYRSPDASEVALEEDCDAEVFLKAFEARHGIAPYIAERFEDPCPIRAWPRFGSRRG